MIFGDNAGDNPVPSISAIMQSVNLYAYCSNNPMNKWDPTGLADEIRYVNTGGSSLRMRVAPGTDSKIIMSIPDGAEVKVIGYRSTRMFNGYWWTTVKYNGQLGFVAESYLSEKPPLSANIAASSGASNTDNNRRPSTGDPGSTYTTPKGDSRTYGPDGKPEIDVDQPHGHNSEPHVHRWPNGVRGPAEPMPSDNNWGAAIAGGIITIIEIASYLYGTPIDLPGN